MGDVFVFLGIMRTEAVGIVRIFYIRWVNDNFIVRLLFNHKVVYIVFSFTFYYHSNFCFSHYLVATTIGTMAYWMVQMRPLGQEGCRIGHIGGGDEL